MVQHEAHVVATRGGAPEGVPRHHCDTLLAPGSKAGRDALQR